VTAPGLALAGTAAVLAAADLTHKAIGGGAEHVHPRSAIYVAVVVVLSVIWAGAIVMTRSLAMAVGGGVVAGGALGNLASLAFWPGVPNPIATASFAFNLADVFVLVGFVAVSVIALRLARVERTRLNQPLRLR
jgi:lipoprotein signal peptidase